MKNVDEHDNRIIRVTAALRGLERYNLAKLIITNYIE